jgi:hypothetical protein
VLAGVLAALEQGLGLVLVGGHVVADLDGPQLAALVRPADAEAPHQAGERGGGRPHVRGHLRVGVVGGVGGREVVRSGDAAEGAVRRREQGDPIPEPAQQRDLAEARGDHDRVRLGDVDADAVARDRRAGLHRADALDPVEPGLDRRRLERRRRPGGGHGQQDGDDAGDRDCGASAPLHALHAAS